MGSDITFCGHKECTAVECMRHCSHIPTKVPVSVAMLDCPYMPLDYFDGYVEVVRCKDCKYYDYGKRFSNINCCCRLKNKDGETVRYYCADDDFCSYGERRADDEAK